MFVVLLGKGLPVQLHGKGDTAAQLDGLLTEFTGGAGTLVQVRQKLLSYLSTNAPSASSVEYDMHLALLELIKIFEARHPGVDTVLPEVCPSPSRTKPTPGPEPEPEPEPEPKLKQAATRCSEFLHTFFNADNKDGKGVIKMGTIHWSKGLEADDVYILQPNTLPLAERIALGDWQKYEELCVQARPDPNP
jgi:hypothetical protein